MTDSGWIGPFLKAPPPELIPGTIHGCLWLLPISVKPIPEAHTWLGLYTSGEPASPLGALIASLDNVDEENEFPYYYNEC